MVNDLGHDLTLKKKLTDMCLVVYKRDDNS